MNFGDAWESALGKCDKETTFGILDFFYENGGNFIDTANNYQAEESETWIGEWMAQHSNRDEMVIATKFTTYYPTAPSAQKGIKSNFQGNHSKSLRVSLEASLKKLGTSYVDLLYIHWWDFSTSIEEVMRSLHHVVASGKVLYLGISDTPAWLVFFNSIILRYRRSGDGWNVWEATLLHLVILDPEAHLRMKFQPVE